MRRALQLSLNVPAVAVLGKVGVEPAERAAHRSRCRARAAEERGARSRDGARRRRCQAHRSGDALCRRWPGRASAIALERTSGRRCHTVHGDCSILLQRGTSATFCIGAPPPDNAPHGRIAFKTGTSYGYRDAWAIGFDGTHDDRCLGRARPDGAPVPGPLRPRVCGADLVRCLCPFRFHSRAVTAGAERH